MKVLTNENNINSLKIVISSKITKKSIHVLTNSIEKLNLKSPKTIPQLVLDSGVHIFSSNASSKFLFPPSVEHNSCVNYYLDVEATVIQPLIATFSGKVSDKNKKSFEEILNQCNNDLISKKFLCGNEITVSDVSIWCALYPIFTDTKFNDILLNKDSLKKWFEFIFKLPEVQESLKLCNIKQGLSSIENLACVQKSTSVKPGSSSSQKFSIPSTPEKTIKDNSLTVTNEEKKIAAAAWKENLPVAGETNILITSALPYVNNVPHLGNIIGCVLSGDVFARFCRLRGYNTLYISGTDEYGTATETKALEEGLTPREICDKYYKIHDAIYKWFGISFDYFGRTTTPQQTEICQLIFKKINENNYIISDVVEQLLCEKCDRYLADRFVEGVCPRCSYEDARGDQCDGCGHLINAPELIKPRCKMCKQTPVLRQSKQFFLDLPKIEPLLKEWIQQRWLDWSHNAREISKAWLNDGLKPRCITRDLKWGIPVPLEGFESKVFYVWFDAPIGYISITKGYTSEWKKWWMPDKNTKVNLYQFMAKDNVPFHSVMFPASLIASKENYVTVSNIFATEYLNYEDGKFSKSRGIGVFGNDAQETGIPADVWRFYLLYVRPESQDSSFSWSDLALKNNSELLSVLGNFINRALMFCEKTFDSKIPNMNLTDENYELVALVNRELHEYISVIEKGKLREGIRHLLSIARLGNQFMQSSQPWVLCKGSEDDKKPFPLFNKIEDDLINKLKAKYAGVQSANSHGKGGDDGKKTGGHIGNDVSSLEAAVVAQGDVVRKMKAAGKTKAEWGPEVTILLDLKKKLAEAQANNQNNSATNPVTPNQKSITEMEEKVKKQGDHVRKLKESGADKSQWQPEVNVLLDLKKQLAELKGEPLPAPSGKKNKKK
ncbi:methionine-tRNA synthetase, putative [Pediculus humanus corporis]|uniref:Methionine--tRNA ligase, cytoplasmic n=1 Tax=Pediculus humanus subsp. corporis TaxID=121224 RepID=E0VDL2_PEDHC|nr:methionine-tRNA synthetase, putative [Pediculus humanus corporis]EEB11468.1 methionine-tRNA synthetase, putative [Pediculus humanus corporis]